MKIGLISRSLFITVYYIVLGSLAWLSNARKVLFMDDPLVILVVSLPLLPIIFIPIMFYKHRIVIYQKKMVYIMGLKKMSYSLEGIRSVYRKHVRQHEIGEGFQRFPYVTFEYLSGKKVYLPFSFLSLSKNTKLLLDQIQKMNPDVTFDQDTLLIKNGKDHPMNKVFRAIILGAGSAIYLFIIILGLIS
ncbi:hypothetical protein [Bacillus timonensis]|uniref:hypothetical protein n=1 Tax=Bacillus timonensis TaxID=1033734 RepID=UPI000288C81B|nr:hypothetical protein [Bacillus timonensis]